MPTTHIMTGRAGLVDRDARMLQQSGTVATPATIDHTSVGQTGHERVSVV